MAKEVHKAILKDIKSAEQIKGEFDNAINFISNEMRDESSKELKAIYPKAHIEI